MKAIHLVGARPNFMKAAPVHAALSHCDGVQQFLIHTGQHYDRSMSDVFFQQLNLPEPDLNLEVGSGTHSQQTAQVMMRLEPVLLERKPNLLIIYGDVNSTVAAALVCAKLGIPIAHVEAGLRSFDRTMPEEINRILTDQVSDFLFTPSTDGNENLQREGIPSERVHLVGNVMIDTVVRLLPAAEARWEQVHAELNIRRYGLVTLHRPSNVDHSETLRALLETLEEIAADIPIVFPVHPRTRQRIDSLLDRTLDDRILLTGPLGYLEFLALQGHAEFVITDSGGVQEETTFLGVPCFTVRENTERPITVTLGTNKLVGRDWGLLRAEVDCILTGNVRQGAIPPLWDGMTAQRIAAVLTR
jgi:UDP-N-acetylglucosamine 2-epimerase (non-hydrolysing)